MSSINSTIASSINNTLGSIPRGYENVVSTVVEALNQREINLAEFVADRAARKYGVNANEILEFLDEARREFENPAPTQAASHTQASPVQGVEANAAADFMNRLSALVNEASQALGLR